MPARSSDWDCRRHPRRPYPRRSSDWCNTTCRADQNRRRWSLADSTRSGRSHQRTPRCTSAAAHGTRVCSLEVAYIGWKSYGRLEHVVAFGAKMTCLEAVLGAGGHRPERSSLRSSSLTRRPSRLSRRSTEITSPAFMNRVRPRWGVNVPAVVCNSGLGGPWGLPSSVMKAKLNGSRPTRPSSRRCCWSACCQRERG